MNIKSYAVMVLLAHIWNIALHYGVESLTTAITLILLAPNFIWCRISEERHAINSWYKSNLECSEMCYTIFLTL